MGQNLFFAPETLLHDLNDIFCAHLEKISEWQYLKRILSFEFQDNSSSTIRQDILKDSLWRCQSNLTILYTSLENFCHKLTPTELFRIRNANFSRTKLSTKG